MKKLIFLALMVSIAALNGFSQAGIIREFTGDVELKPAGAAAFIPAAAGDTVAQDTIVSTGFKSTAIIAVGSATITVRPLTRLSLAEIQSSEGAETLNVSLQAGRVRVEVKPPAGTRASTTVQSPSATASVRGTEFDMDNDSVTVSHGKVVFEGNNGFTQTVNAGFKSEIASDGSSSNPALTAEETLMPQAPPGSGLAGENTPASTSSATGDMLFEIDWSSSEFTH
ncbi:MAG: FecR family protein [Treponema sp.]|jgi:hypothetical protein|nr:FecR family protein [Treponema sp.]